MTTDEHEGVAPCPDCDGGRDESNDTCERCCGNGEIVVDWARYLRCSEDDAAMADAAWKRQEAARPAVSESTEGAAQRSEPQILPPNTQTMRPETGGGG